MKSIHITVFISLLSHLSAITGLVLTAPFDSPGQRTASSLDVKFYADENTVDGSVESYELSHRSVFESLWTIFEDPSISTMQTGQLESQVLSIRIDADISTEVGGTFTLGIVRSSLIPDDFEHLARTPRIPWNADSSQLLSALRHLKGVRIKEVKRCDEFGDAEVGHGGSEQWFGGCPFLNDGGYRWLIVFAEPIQGATVPKLHVFRNELKKGWSGPGEQIMISRVDKGLINPAACIHGICSVNVTNLQESTPYLFRIRAKKSLIGWTEYSKISSALTTLEFRIPGRPRSPLFQAASLNQIEMSLSRPPAAFRAISIESQYRVSSGGNSNSSSSSAAWIDGPALDVGQEGEWGNVFSSGATDSATLFLNGLFPSTSYEVRIRYSNAAGAGPYSTVGTVRMTTADRTLSLPSTITLNISRPSAGETPSVTSDSIVLSIGAVSPPASPLVAENSEPKTTLFALQYRSAVAAAAGDRMSGGGYGWETHPNAFRLRTQGQTGVVIQEVSVFSEVGTMCRGEFFLEMWDEDNPLGNSFTPGISFGATEDDMVDAYMAMDRLKRANAVVRVSRVGNLYGGYTYEIKIIGGGKLPTPQIRRNTFKYTYQPEFNSTGDETYPPPVERPCWQRSSAPVNVRTVSEGDTAMSVDEVEVAVRSLRPYTTYEVRVVEYPFQDGDAENAVRSPVLTVTTEPRSDILETFIAATISSASATMKANTLSASTVVIGSFDASGNIAARVGDQDFQAGVGIGGVPGLSGGNGLCIFVLYSARDEQPFEILRYSFIGPIAQHYHVPTVSSTNVNTVSRVTIKCWGGGGGGGQPSDQREIPNTSLGGGGAFGQISVIVAPGDMFTIEVAGGGQGATGEEGGKGGFGGGGAGGRGRGGGGGGAGGGASVVALNSEMVMNVAGGGGGGSSDYCCAHGGGGGSISGGNGTHPGAASPWPISALGEEGETPVTRRYEYTSALCDAAYSTAWDGGAGSASWCISKWDILPATLPAEHEHIDYGHAPNKNYVVWAAAGAGGSQMSGGSAGVSSEFEVRTGGDASVEMGDGRVAVFTQSAPASWGGGLVPMNGRWLYGGRGADGTKGAGGGGGGFFGGGGGGSGIDAAGGGGGSSFTAISLSSGRLLSTGDIPALPATVSEPPVPVLMHLNESGATFSWSRYWPGIFAGALPKEYLVELAYGPHSDDFVEHSVYRPERPYAVAQEAGRDTCTIGGLTPMTIHRFRVVPVYGRSASGRGAASGAVTFTTLAVAANYWEPVRSRRLSLAATARGISGPVLQQPNIDEGAEIYTERETANYLPETRYVDADTGLKHSKPSPRRGQTLTFVPDKGLVYLFGGRTDGYPCALSYKDTTDRGAKKEINSGREVYPCATKQNEVNEVWTWNVKTYQWEFINTTYGTFAGAGVYNPEPEPRELHTTAYVEGNMYVFGGKSHASGLPDDTFFADLWRLNVEHAFPIVLAGSDSALAEGATDLPLQIPHEGKRIYLALNATNSPHANTFSSTTGIGSDRMCVNSVALKIHIKHDCMKQLRISLMGPGFETGAANFDSHSSSDEVILLDQRSREPSFCTGGEKEFTFVDRVSVGVEKLPTSECCSPENSSYVFISEGPLAEFTGAPLDRVWTVVVQDMVSDSFIGEVVDWELHFEVDTCRQRHSWEYLSGMVTGDSPPARYLGNAIVHKQMMFLYGGRGNDNLPINDLYRLDTRTLVWTMLSPVRFNEIALDTASMVGASYVMSFWGLLRFGGLLRYPTLPSDFQRYVNDVYAMDPVTLKWKLVQVEPSRYGLTSTGRNIGDRAAVSPTPRYLTSIAYIPSSQVWWPQSVLSYRALYDQRVPSSTVNYAGAGIDSLMVYGGVNGASGLISDGSTGGMLGDVWKLRYGNWSTPGSRADQLAYMHKHCSWRSGAADNPSKACLSTETNSPCDLRDLMMMVWCELGDTSILIE